MLDEAADIGDELGRRRFEKWDCRRCSPFETRALGNAAGAGKSSSRETPRVFDRGCQRQWYGDLAMDDLKKFMSSIVPYWETLGLELVEVEPGRSVFTANVRPQLLQNGLLHGGVLASIADSACAVAAISRVYPTSYATTINLQLAYLKPVREGRFRAEGKCLRAGKNVLFSEAQVFDDQEALVCSASSQLLVIPWSGPKASGT